ncbi:putative PIN family toxin of toxin-antitoxin system [Virgibacillus halotolerans]|uniref:putative toxin-antitoxin system toxin component, PIN family n=1 Tax=Virgibacillus halotolerans TaxID=1071053 RepID=UPI001961EE50|nr:putative toxin-antitoxin system toxin component, PIN family [Virgibacillus halotolerans]MBM7598082.1 putative PIN family toxin of toxin-antitoxin system [Virgibacillus halotolerans]
MASRIVVDTNVFIGAIFGEETSDSANLLATLDENGVRIVFSQEFIGELMYIMKRHCNSLGLDYESTRQALINITDLFQQGKSTNTRHLDRELIPVINDPDDQMLVEAAYSSDADYLITWDKKSGILDLDGYSFKCCTPLEYMQDLEEVV